ncbi:hypothetical protein [Parvibaculum sp.]|uniref:hypothetical protein n=1 Tax=Parvibaculum sp. TaxID=2024848 RepID=UPI001E07419E|nr:hypothetical protein [Parvibaculum sp.]MBX3488678.1 hypothetical protein [Parvibaculum sp.]MCW5727439.1 hypothetical protein [Parvibaculum sp.]
MLVQALSPDESDVQSLSQPEHGLRDDDLSVVVVIGAPAGIGAIRKRAEGRKAVLLGATQSEIR